MSFLNSLLQQMERSTAGSEETARTVMRMCGDLELQNALFLGDDIFTPQLIQQQTGANVLATFHEDFRAEKLRELGFDTRVVGAYELVEREGGWELVWYNGSTEPDGVQRRLEQLRGILKNGGVAVYRTLCWLIDPSPDTKGYVERRFGRPVPLDSVLLSAREQGFKIKDFYIAPKTDWVSGFYKPLDELLKQYEGTQDGDAAAGIGEVNKETYMFELHSEEYSFVYYILE